MGQKLSVSDYAFEKQVIAEGSDQEFLAIPLDQESLKNINDRFGNVNVFDERNEEIPFSAFYKNPKIVKNVSLVQVSSQRQGSPEFIVDEDFTTSFLFSEKDDKKDASWFLVDLGRPVPLNRVELFLNESSRVKEVQLETGLSPQSLEKSYDRKPFRQSIELPQSPITRYLKVSFWGLRVDISDIRITSSREGILYVKDPSSYEKIRILYGGNVADKITYEERFSTPFETNAIAKVTKQAWNAVFPKDVDQDGKENPNDNCPFIKNSSQSDKDEDTVGDACDNAPKVKNITQTDSDQDGVGDIIDNCKLIKNADQADRDDDGIGDACDSAHAEANENSSEKKLLLQIFGGLLLILVFGTIWNITSSSSKK